jgi:hypothetical protein
MRKIEFRVGIPEVSGRFLIEAKKEDYKIMVSASRFWKRKRGAFAKPGRRLEGLDVFLDSAGFTAMRHWGGFPWTTDQYLDLVSQGAWTHWSQMDLCCEPEIAKNEKEVMERVDGTARLLYELCDKAKQRGIPPPLPVLQGWTPRHYRRSAELAGSILRGSWPDLVGVGSVCRRDVHGPSGVLSIVDELDTILPRNVRIHLFGVKSQALATLQGCDRVHSTDSMAWDLRVRWQCRKTGERYNMDKRIEGLHQWVAQQQKILEEENAMPQIKLPLWKTL